MLLLIVFNKGKTRKVLKKKQKNSKTNKQKKTKNKQDKTIGNWHHTMLN